jgi:hypothetical protein
LICSYELIGDSGQCSALDSFLTAETRTFRFLSPFYCVLSWSSLMMALCKHYSEFPIIFLDIVFLSPRHFSCKYVLTVTLLNIERPSAYSRVLFVYCCLLSNALSHDLDFPWFYQALYLIISVSLEDFDSLPCT